MNRTGYLLDTNVVSERRKRRPEERVVRFLDSIEEGHVCLSVLTIGELRRGATMMRGKDKEQASRLDSWIDSLEATFADRILPIDLTAAKVWGELSARRPRPVVDGLIAATAIARSLTLVTRNTRDMADTGASLVDPWQGA